MLHCVCAALVISLSLSLSPCCSDKKETQSGLLQLLRGRLGGCCCFVCCCCCHCCSFDRLFDSVLGRFKRISTHAKKKKVFCFSGAPRSSGRCLCWTRETLVFLFLFFPVRTFFFLVAQRAAAFTSRAHKRAVALGAYNVFLLWFFGSFFLPSQREVWPSSPRSTVFQGAFEGGRR